MDASADWLDNLELGMITAPTIVALRSALEATDYGLEMGLRNL